CAKGGSSSFYWYFDLG
nr:immunoglobulin heavy chain junction region [Macaca mulatta]